MRFDAVMALFEDLPGEGRACLLAPYLGMLQLQLPRLEAAYEARQVQELGDAAHSIKGGSRDLGFARLGLLSEVVEVAGRSGRMPEPETWNAFHREVAWIRGFIGLV